MRDVWGVPLGPTLSPCGAAVQQRAINQRLSPPSFFLPSVSTLLILKQKMYYAKNLFSVFKSF